MLIEVTSKVIGTKEVNAVPAKELYLGLGLASAHWSTWADLNIVENEFFTENVDWVRFSLNVNPTNGLPIKDFAVSIDFAKHIAMMAKTEKAHAYRNYFIECERKVLTTEKEQSLKLSALAVEAAKAFGLEGNQAYLSADRAIKTMTGVSALNLLGIDLVSDQERYLTPTEIGKRLDPAISNRKVNLLLAEKGLQFKNEEDEWAPTVPGKEFAVLLDTGKKHSNGTPIQQLKWKETVIGELK